MTIEPPDPNLPWSPESLRAWHKITGNLGDRWEPIFRAGAFVAASQCANYLACCRAFGPHADVTRECGAIARAWLAEMDFPLTEADPIPRDDLGRDIALVQCVGAPPTRGRR